jgi:hypothetical protein
VDRIAVFALIPFVAVVYRFRPAYFVIPNGPFVSTNPQLPRIWQEWGRSADQARPQIPIGSLNQQARTG